MRYVGPREIVIDAAPAPVPFWQTDRSFTGETVVIIGGGPSHGAMDLDVLRGHRFIACNSCCRKVAPVATRQDVLYFTDNSWSERRPELLRAWPGPVVTSNRNSKARLGDAVRRLDLETLTRWIDVGIDYVQASSGHTAACLAIRMGAKRVVLIGFECRGLEGLTHGHTDYDQHDLGCYEERFRPGWRALAPRFVELGAEVINATPDSAIEEFNFVPLEEALRSP
jgi:hypothetical protein